MIFATVGTHPQPFDRLLRALRLIEEDELVVQHGSGRPPDNARLAKPFFSFAETVELFNRADKVITHAGVGSVLCATNAGHTPLVVPRLRRYGEHIDDHQLQLIRELDRAGSVLGVWEIERLVETLSRVPPRCVARSRPVGVLHAEVRRAMGLEDHAGQSLQRGAIPPERVATRRTA